MSTSSHDFESLLWGAASTVVSLYRSPKKFLTWTLVRFIASIWVLIVGFVAAIPFAALLGFSGFSILTSDVVSQIVPQTTMSGSADPWLTRGMVWEETPPELAMLQETLEPLKWVDYDRLLQAASNEWLTLWIVGIVGFLGLIVILVIVASYSTLLIQSLARHTLSRDQFPFREILKCLWSELRNSWRAVSHLLWKVSIPILIWGVAVCIVLLGILVSGEATALITQAWILGLVAIVTFLTAIIWTIILWIRYLFAPLIASAGIVDVKASFIASDRLTHGVRWELFFIPLLIGISVSIVDSVLQWVLGMVVPMSQSVIPTQLSGFLTLTSTIPWSTLLISLITWTVLSGIKEAAIYGLYRSLSQHS